MKLQCHPETDSLYIELNSMPGAEVCQIAEGLNVDVDADGEVVGLDFDFASQRFNLSRLETVALPVAKPTAA